MKAVAVGALLILVGFILYRFNKAGKAGLPVAAGGPGQTETFYPVYDVGGIPIFDVTEITLNPMGQEANAASASYGGIYAPALSPLSAGYIAQRDVGF